MSILVAAEVLTALLAYRTSDVPEEFGDSRTATLAMCMHFQSWVVGVPILAVLGDASANAAYFGRVLVIRIFSISSVLVVVGPKVYRSMVLKLWPNVDESTAVDRVRVSGVTLPAASSSRKMQASRAPVDRSAPSSGETDAGSGNLPQESPLPAVLESP
jgi:hypothetical protein